MCYSCFWECSWARIQLYVTQPSILKAAPFDEASGCCLSALRSLMCGLSFFIFFQVSQKMNDVCYTVCLPLEPSGKVMAKEAHGVLLLCSDIHLGNSNRAFTVVKKCGSSSIYSCWIFLGLLRLFIVNTVVCVVPRAHPPAATIETICIPYQISAVRRCKQCVSRGRPPLVFPSK